MSECAGSSPCRAAAAFLSDARGIFGRMPAPSGRTALARRRPPRPPTPPAAVLPLGAYGLPPTRRLAHYPPRGLRPSALSELLPGMYHLPVTIGWAPWKITPSASVAAPRY